MFVLVVVGNSARADLISFEIEGTAALTVDGVYSTNRDFRILVSIDNGTVDQFTGDPSRGGFGGATTLLSLPQYGISNQRANNVNGIRQEATALFLAQDTNLYNNAFSMTNLPAGAVVDVKQLAPLSVSPVSPTWTGAGLTWQLESGSTVQFNQAASYQLSNFSAVPEPSSLGLFALAAAMLAFPPRKFARR